MSIFSPPLLPFVHRPGSWEWTEFTSTRRRNVSSPKETLYPRSTTEPLSVPGWSFCPEVKVPLSQERASRGFHWTGKTGPKSSERNGFLDRVRYPPLPVPPLPLTTRARPRTPPARRSFSSYRWSRPFVGVTDASLSFSGFVQGTGAPRAPATSGSTGPRRYLRADLQTGLRTTYKTQRR